MTGLKRKSNMAKSLSFRNIIDYLSSDKFKAILKWIVFGSLLVYMLVTLSSYAAWFPGSTRFFAYNTTVGFIIRMLASLLVFGAGILTWIAYRDKVEIKWFIVFCILILMSVVGLIYTPTRYTTLYRTTKLYDFMVVVDSAVSVKSVVTMTLSFIMDVAFGYCLLFIFPHSLKQSYLFLIIFSVFVLLMDYSCFYSFIKERAYYVKFFKGDWQYNADTIGSIFGNKQQWGLFLAVSIPVIVVSLYLFICSNATKILKVVFSLFCFVSFVMICICTMAAFSKTAILSVAAFGVCFLIGLIFACFKKKKTIWISIFLILVSSVVFTYVILVMNIESLRDSPIGAFVYKIVDTLIKRGEVGAESRFDLIKGLFQNFSGVNLMFGFNKGVFDAYVRALLPELEVNIHSGFAIMFGRTGIFGFLLSLILFAFLIVLFVKNYRNNTLFMFILFATLASYLVMNVGESEILIFSCSGDVFLYNIILCMLPLIYVGKSTEAKITELKYA